MKFLLLLVLSITTDAIKKSATVGKNFTYWCKYNQDISSLKTFFCKGEDPSICKPLINNRKTHINRLSTSDTKNKITITVREITLNDSGTYWCGAERPDNQTSNVFFGRLFLTVELRRVPDEGSPSSRGAEVRGSCSDAPVSSAGPQLCLSDRAPGREAGGTPPPKGPERAPGPDKRPPRSEPVCTRTPTPRHKEPPTHRHLRESATGRGSGGGWR
uniref:Immunoglobulin V-set domain-containing protein n=1 Tax=Maylandia zebra TaxID=106582 RepID=A0A3P9D047_9CICH